MDTSLEICYHVDTLSNYQASSYQASSYQASSYQASSYQASSYQAFPSYEIK
jgi:hypothetical protein